MKGLGAVRRPHPVDLDDDEAELCLCLHAGERAERSRDKGPLRAGVDVLDHRVLLVRIEVRRTDDDPPDVGFPIAALRHEHLGWLPPGGQERRSVRLLEVHDHLPITRAPQLHDGRDVHARPTVQVIPVIWGEYHHVHPVRVRERRQPRAVDVDAVVVDEVGILARIHAARVEPNLPLRGVHPVHAAHHPIPPGDLVLHFPREAVVAVQVVPPVALRHPDDFPSVIDVVAELLPRVVEEGGHLLVDDRAGLPRLGIDLDHAVDLVSTLVVLEREGAPIVAPLDPGHVVCIREQRVVDDGLRVRRHVEQHGRVPVEHVARLVVEHGRVPGLELVVRRRRDVVHLALVARAHAVRGEVAGIRRPGDGLGVVGVPLGPVRAQQHPLSAAGRPHVHVVVSDGGFPLAIRRALRPVHRRAPGAEQPAAEHAPLACRAVGAAACRVAHVLRERTAPPHEGRIIGRGAGAAAPLGEFDRPATVGEGEAAEREVHGGDRLPHGGRERGAEALVIERGAFGQGGRIDEHERLPAVHRRLAIPEPVPGREPDRGIGGIDDESFRPESPERLGANIVGRRPLCPPDGGRQEPATGQDGRARYPPCGSHARSPSYLRMSSITPRPRRSAWRPPELGRHERGGTAAAWPARKRS